MTEKELEKILDSIRMQLDYERKIEDTINNVMCPESIESVMTSPLWKGMVIALDLALGVEDFTSTWVWEMECGKGENAWMKLRDIKYPLTNAREILEFARNYNKKED